jgi:hypothetical protein
MAVGAFSTVLRLFSKVWKKRTTHIVVVVLIFVALRIPS